MPIKIVVGLGNPGTRYATTRHNIGQRVIEALEENKPEGVWLFVPDSFMNTSGTPVAAFLRKKGCAPQDALVLSDDFELPLGQLRLRRSGSSGGHNGLKSIFECLGTDEVPRLRIGVGPVPEGIDPKDFVLQAFARSEESKIRAEIIPRAADAVRRAISDGLEKAMNEFNTKVL